MDSALLSAVRWMRSPAPGKGDPTYRQRFGGVQVGFFNDVDDSAVYVLADGDASFSIVLESVEGAFRCYRIRCGKGRGIGVWYASSPCRRGGACLAPLGDLVELVAKEDWGLECGHSATLDAKGVAWRILGEVSDEGTSGWVAKGSDF